MDANVRKQRKTPTISDSRGSNCDAKLKTRFLFLHEGIDVADQLGYVGGF